jgi:GT2 family glycosyltransferase
MISVTYISKDRPNHLKRSVKSLFSQTVKPEHIVITDCSDDKASIENVIDELKKESQIPITFIWRPKEELSRSQGRNLGREYVKTPIAVSTESDILFPQTIIEETLKVFGNPPQKRYVQTYISLEEENGTEKRYNWCGNAPNCNCGFFQVYRVEDFDNIGGYNPFFKGWGYEDYDFSQRMISLGCSHVIVPLYVMHMWHPSTSYLKENNHDQNKAISQKIRWDNIKKTWA